MTNIQISTLTFEKPLTEDSVCWLHEHIKEAKKYCIKEFENGREMPDYLERLWLWNCLWRNNMTDLVIETL